MDVQTAVALSGALALILANAFFVAVEFALVAVDRTEVELVAARGDRRAKLVESSVERLSFHLSGAQLGITVSSIVLGFVAEPTVARLLGGPIANVVGESNADAVSLVISLALATVAQMVIGELIPKAVAVSRPLPTAMTLAPATRVYMVAFSPVIRLFGGVADRCVRRLGMEPKEELSIVRSRPELVRLVRTSQVAGTLDRAEALLLSRVFRFGDKFVADVLTPRPDVVTIAADADGAALARLAARTGFSRFPVVATDIDDIVGLVLIKSLLGVPFPDRSTTPVSSLMSAPFLVPESRKLDLLLRDMRRDTQYLAVVLDEYGGTAGVVTLEDLLEEIVGEIDDEHDLRSRTVREVGRTKLVPGGLHPDEVFESCGFVIPDGDYETLAGFVLDRLGRIPTAGEVFELDGWRFSVVRMNRRRIETVQITAPPEDT